VSTLPILIVELMLGSALYGEPPDEDVSAAAARYEANCAGSTTPECKRLQWQIEGVLYGLARARLAVTGKAVNSEVLLVALEADTPQLKAFALRSISRRPPDDLLPLIQTALDSPYAMVREPALNLLGRFDPRYARYSDRRANRSEPPFPIADPVPDEDALGGPLYPGATFRPFASNEQLALFTTADPPDNVIAFYAKGNRKALTGAELTAEQKKRASTMNDPMAMMELVKKAKAEGKDPTAAIMAKEKEMVGSAIDSKAFERGRGVVSPRYVALNDVGSRTVAVFKDDSLGTTSIVFFLPSHATDHSMTPGANPMQQLKLQQYIRQPLIDSEK
jgi:hypothetical protein